MVTVGKSSAWSLHSMDTEPFGECIAIQFPCCKLQNDLLLLIHRGSNLVAVQKEKDFHGRVSGTLVPVHKGMVLDEGEA